MMAGKTEPRREGNEGAPIKAPKGLPAMKGFPTMKGFPLSRMARRRTSRLR